MGLLRRKPRLGRQRKRSARSPLAEREQRAYVLLEEARLRYERLMAARDTDDVNADETDAYALLHRQLGMAGFCVSAHIPSQRRRVSIAHRRCGTAGEHRGDAMYRVLGLVHRAWSAVDQGRGIPELSDPMQQAYAHLLSAQELFGVIARGARRSSSSHADPDRPAPSRAPTTKSSLPPSPGR
jgi:hypothetical protein